MPSNCFNFCPPLAKTFFTRPQLWNYVGSKILYGLFIPHSIMSKFLCEDSDKLARTFPILFSMFSPKPHASATGNNFLHLPHAVLSNNSCSHTTCPESPSTHLCLCISFKGLLICASSMKLSSTLSAYNDLFHLINTLFISKPHVHYVHSEIIVKWQLCPYRQQESFVHRWHLISIWWMALWTKNV